MKSLLAMRVGMCLLIFAHVKSYAWTGLMRKAREPSLMLSSKSIPADDKSFSEALSESDRSIVPTMRRKILTTVSAGAAIAPVIFLTRQSSIAAVPMDAGEAIRRGAANIPGYGSSDVFYPKSFEGSWKMTRDVEFPSASASSSSVLRLTYPVRFIQSIEDDAVVADRGYNQAELEAALARRVNSDSSSPAVLSYEWAANNPNVVNVALSDGTKKEIKVTKRATERSEDTVSSSEFQRITQEDTRQIGGPGAIPQISARRVVSKWKKIDDSTLEGIEIVYAVSGGGDPLSTSLPGQSKNNAAPTVLSKSRLYLVR